jgi:protocatechuate 3,4-dioxygenase beta subunit
MNDPSRKLSRRTILGAGALGAGLLATGGRRLPGQDGKPVSKEQFLDELVRTPRQTEGPFYPNKLPLDTDNDLLIINDLLTPAIGAVTHLSGRVLDTKGNVQRGVVVEIWQVAGIGVYLHEGSGNAERRDGNFQGFGRFLTASSGEYYFRTIRPVPYPGRTPHIHFKLKRGNKELLTTQCYVKGEAGNERDGVLRGIRDPKVRAAVMVDFVPIEGSQIGELGAKFDIVIGATV